MSADRDNEGRAPRGTHAGGLGDWGRGPDLLTVAAYLKSAHGFLVDTTSGDEVGAVDDVILDPATGSVVELDVRGGWFGRRRNIIDVADVVDVFPEIRRLVVTASAVREPER